MKSTITLFKLIAMFLIAVYSNPISAQTYFFQDAVENATIWHNGAAEVANPKSDAVNSSSIVLQNTGASGWQETQFFPSGYTIQTGDKFFISFYNPNGAANWQLRMDLSTSGSFVQIGGSDPAHDSGAASGWHQVSLDLSTYVGQNITKIQLYPTAGESKSISYDNIFIGTGQGGSNTTTKTFFFQDAVENGTIWHNGAAEVANPKSDAVNSSSIVLQNTGSSGWQETQFFPTGYTIKDGDKFFISFYNPNGAANWQLRMDLSTSGSFVQISGSDPTHDSGAASGWHEVNLDLSTYVGQNITKIQLYPTAGESKSINYDNVYIGSTTTDGGGSATQTYLFQDAVENGTIWHNGVSSVTNPKSDAINSSSIVLQNTGASGWQETQFFPTGYTVKAGDKFFISFYNPNGAANWQLRMDLSTSGSFVQISGGDPVHNTAAATGWNEVSLDLSSYVGQNITKIQLYPAAGESKSINFDNIYISSASVLSVESINKLVNRAFISSEGSIHFEKELLNTTLYVFDIKGALLFKEIINGKKSVNSLPSKGLYFIKIKNGEGSGNFKVLFH